MMSARSSLQSWLTMPYQEVFAPPLPGYKDSPSPQPLYIQDLKSVYGESQLLPIESLKHDAAFWLDFVASHNGYVARTFRSSGTTNRDRSVSPFSERGLELYRQASVHVFWTVLRHFFDLPKSIGGISFIPPPDAWPESSLAQMLAWIGETGRLSYQNADEFFTPPREPVWLFATAFHLVQYADSGKRCPLPPGSVVIETGGTKGRSRSLSRQELYELIEEVFSVRQNRIISEYGMCEMATPAYDFVEEPDSDPKHLTQRRYRFPSWVNVHVADPGGQIRREGFGTLIVNDPMRTDLPWPLRTEDMVTLEGSGRFSLHGRVPSTALKGCSLLAEDWQGKLPPLRLAHAQAAKAEERNAPDQVEVLQRASVVNERVAQLWKSEEHDKLLRELVGSPTLGMSLKDDLRRSAPATPGSWAAAAQESISANTPGRWLIIPPSTHPIAALYPLTVAAVLGLDLTIRCSSGEELLHFWKEHFADLIRIELCPASYRIGDSPAPSVDALLAFGSDETIAQMREQSPWPVQGFGSHITATLVRSSNFNSKEIQNLIWKDALSLAQKGCMSSRLLIIWDIPAKGLEGPALNFFQDIGRTWAAPIPGPEALALVHAHFQMLQEGRDVLPRRSADDPLISSLRWSNSLELSSILAHRAWTLPMVLVNSGLESELTSWLKRESSLSKLSACSESRALVEGLGIEICELGAANAPEWNGRHHGRQLFCPCRNDSLCGNLPFSNAPRI